MSVLTYFFNAYQYINVGCYWYQNVDTYIVYLFILVCMFATFSFFITILGMFEKDQENQISYI